MPAPDSGQRGGPLREPRANGASILMTSAPMSARIRVANGPAHTQVRSRMRTPASGSFGWGRARPRLAVLPLLFDPDLAGSGTSWSGQGAVLSLNGGPGC